MASVTSEGTLSSHAPELKPSRSATLMSFDTINSLYSWGSLTSNDLAALRQGGRTRMLAAALLYNEKVELTVGTIILCNFILITMMTDRSVQNQPIPLWMDVTNWTCLAVYTLEMVVFLYVERMRTFLHFRQCFDVVVVVASVTGEILEAVKVGVGTGTFSLLRVFRLMRLLRIVRAARALGQIKELMKLVQMMASCFKTLFWAFCMTFLVMTMWSHLAVLFIQPLIEELDQKHVWDDCGSRCQKAFVSVMRANLTFFPNSCCLRQLG